MVSSGGKLQHARQRGVVQAFFHQRHQPRMQHRNGEQAVGQHRHQHMRLKRPGGGWDRMRDRGRSPAASRAPAASGNTRVCRLAIG